MAGYLAFPEAVIDDMSTRPTHRSPLSSIQEAQANASRFDASAQSDIDEEKKLQEEERAKKRAEHEERRRQRHEYMQQQIWLSELDWVRSGGVLRNQYGRRDGERTEKARMEIRLQEEERKIKEEWDAYEARWRALQAGETPATWREVPWPVHEPPMSPADLTPDAVAEFIFAPFKIRGSTGSRKDRIRASFLRWHPDKFPVAALAQVSDDERDMVSDGIRAVFMSLKLIQDAEKLAAR